MLVFLSILSCGISAFGSITVGRIAHVEGKIYRYRVEDQNWLETFVNSPAGTLDILSTGKNSRAEISFPGNVLVGLADHTEIEIRSLEGGSREIVLHKGLARFVNRSAAIRLEVDTFMGTVIVGPASGVDVALNVNSVAVAAVHGEASFRSVINGDKKLEVISGSTSLIFHEDSVIAGTGPLDRQWDRWWAERELVRAQGRQVRSEFLPSAMQEYAHVLNSNGSWRRVYLRGYYYWAWQPRHVAAGWGPYSTGFWYSWQGEPVWIDHNPWGWVTHHHGHWLRMRGAWLWTPYIHVSAVPGVTTAGFSITFGRTFRPSWHPGRVRWISHSTYIGWLPLAPWENYYGYRSWGPGSVTVGGGVNPGIRMSLTQHKYVEHATIIPKHYFYQRAKRAGIKNYHTVKVRNISKTVIVNNYRPIPTMPVELRHGTYEKKTTRGRKQLSRNVILYGREKTGEYGAAHPSQKREYHERKILRNRKKITQSAGTIDGRRTGTIEKKRHRNLRSEQRNRVLRSWEQAMKDRTKPIATRDKTKRSIDVGGRTRPGNKLTRQAVLSADGRTGPRQKDKIGAARQRSMKDRKLLGTSSRFLQGRVQGNEVRANRKNKKKHRESDKNETRLARLLGSE